MSSERKPCARPKSIDYFDTKELYELLKMQNRPDDKKEEKRSSSKPIYKKTNSNNPKKDLYSPQRSILMRSDKF